MEGIMRYTSTESKILEFKERLDDYSRLLETVVAFANTQGGTIIIGIRDSDRLVVGLSDEEITRYGQEIPQAIADAISPQTAVDLYAQNIEGKTCVSVRIFPGPQKPYFLKKLGYPAGIFLRFGAHNRKADTYATEQLARTQSGKRFEQNPCPEISYDDLSKELLGLLFSRYDPSILIGAGYAATEVSGRTIPNVAGTLLFYPEHQKIVPESGISISAYADEGKLHLLKKEEFGGGLIPMLEQSFTYLSMLLGTEYERDGLIKRPQSHEIPLDAIREALVNAVAHRAYDYEAPIRITLFPDRIEFLNPGDFYAPINPDNLREGLSRYRNPLIADALRKKGYMEKQGIGINLIISSCLEAGLSEPRFAELEHHVKLIIFRKRTETEQKKKSVDPYDIESMRIHFSTVGLFSSKELAHYLGKSVSLAKKLLSDLQKRGIVEMVGKGPGTKYRFI